jgi:CRISPR-associated protein Cmr6
MSFAKAYEKAASKKGEKIDMPKQVLSVETNPERVPMMYRAQISGRCSLMFAGDNNRDLNDWTQEWVFPMENGEPHYQHEQPKLGLDDFVYRFEIEFPFRVCSNCGQDNILRPVIIGNKLRLHGSCQGDFSIRFKEKLVSVTLSVGERGNN